MGRKRTKPEPNFVPATEEVALAFDPGPRRRDYYSRLIEDYAKKCLRRGAQLKAIDRSTPPSPPHLRLLLQCSCTHRFWLDARHISDRRNFCANCGMNAERAVRLKAAQGHAKSLGGQLLSTAYVTAREPLRWLCDQGHAWSATWDNVHGKKSWCPECATKAWADARRNRPRKKGRVPMLIG